MLMTDDIRILAALSHGYVVRRYYRAGYKFRRAPEYWCAMTWSQKTDWTHARR